ncbi:CD74 molecule, major histocompatibility complex, class II invariant chain a isoform X1 [Osmerus mordax]|uniref:HLA class II histocompatibility antigen gamma chain n=1 Tax=Osmerus mordax TaxID=8014 RepID=C1BLW9_OSMMO|nr:HLA class II histocompatibility antigen gamma chain [Osmerus mordax]
MEDHQPQDDSLLRAGSEEALVSPRAPPGGSNNRAFKVAGLTVLACLLLASQGLTAYLVISQRGQIHNLQKNTDKMNKKITIRSHVAPVQMHVPMNTMPLLKDFSDEEPKEAQTPMSKLQFTAIVSVEKQVKDLLQNVSLPEFNQSFLKNVQSLQTKMESEEWMSFETWMRHWLIFQMAQQSPPVPASALQTKCRLQTRILGSYQPQCDAQGHFMPMQCWHSTGYCWCVDSEGTAIPGTEMRGKPTCGGVPKPAPGLRRMVPMLKTMQLESDVQDK